MIKNILNIVGWLGTALVVAAVAVRLLRPEWDQYAIYGAWAGLACVVLYALGQWREHPTVGRVGEGADEAQDGAVELVAQA